jgi:hypothetical protein
MTSRRVLYIIGSAAPPVRQLDEACRAAIDLGWDPCVILTPTAADWVDVDRLAEVTGKQVRVQQRRPDEPDPFPPADAVLAAPLTFNTINKWAAGINDTVALGILNELLVGGPPIVAVPCAKSPLRDHPAYVPNVHLLEEAGVVFLNADDFASRATDGLAAFSWPTVLKLALQ